MARFRLQALAPKRICVGRNADGTKRFVDFTDAHAKRYVDQGNAMLAAGLHVPAIWEHRDDGKPRKLSLDDWNTERTKGVAGWVSTLELADGKAWANVEIPDETDAKQAEKVRFCSPEIDNFTDGDGKDWGEVFTHLALTPRPVQHDQPPIARLSLNLGPIRLAFDPEKGNDMADDKEPKGKKDEPKGKGDKGDEDAGAGDLKALIAALQEAHDLVIPDEVDDIPKLIIAVKASGKSADDAGDDEVAPVIESQTAGGAGGSMALSLQKQTAAAEKLAKANTKAEIGQLLKRGQVTTAIHDDLVKRLDKVRLSFSAEGDLVPNDVLTEVKAYAKLPANRQSLAKPPGKVRLGNVREVDHAIRDDEPDDSEEARQQRRADWDAMTNRRAKA